MNNRPSGRKKIVLFYAWGTINAGDHALCLGALELLTTIVPEVQIVVVSRFAKNIKSGNPVDDIKRRFPDVKIIPGPFPFSRDTKIKKALQYSYGLVLSSVCIVFPFMVLALFKNMEFLRHISEAKIVLLNGGNLFYWHRVRKAPARLMAFAFPLILSKRFNVPYGFLPQTAGPFEGRISHLIGKLFKNASFVLFRDSQSAENINKITNLSTIPSIVAPDLAFFLTEKKDKLSVETLPGPSDQVSYIAVVLRTAPLGVGVSLRMDNPDRTKKKLMDIIPNFLFELQRKTENKVFIVVQDKDDEEISRSVYLELIKNEGSAAELIEIRDPYDFISFYKRAVMVFSMRLHSMIFALSQGTPVIGLWRQALGEKIPSMMNDLGLSNFAFEMDTVEKEKLLNAALQISDQRDQIKRKILQLNRGRKASALKFLSSYIDK